MSETLIFCGSYPQIKNTLFLAGNVTSGKKITVVIPDHEDLYRFFTEINRKKFADTLNIVFFRRFSGERGSGNSIMGSFFVFPDIIRERRYLDDLYRKYFADVSGADVWYSSRCYSPYTYYFLKKLTHHNRVHHIPDPSGDDRIHVKPSYRVLSELVSLVIGKLIFGFGLTRMKMASNTFFCISDPAYAKITDHILTPEERDREEYDFDYDQFRVFETGQYRVMFFDDGLLEAGYVEKETYRKELAGIFRILSAHYATDEIAVKYHPGYPGDKLILKEYSTVPEYIPAEFLYNEYVQVYLSMVSLSLAGIENGMIISTADLITFNDPVMKRELKEYLVRHSRSEVLFPATLSEFEEIISSVAP